MGAYSAIEGEFRDGGGEGGLVEGYCGLYISVTSKVLLQGVVTAVEGCELGGNSSNG